MSEVREAVPVEAEIIDGNALAAISRAEIDVQIATAKQYPRSIVSFKREALEQATLDADTAESMYFSLERRDKDGNPVKIQGPSIRMAEIALSCWGNCHAAARHVSAEDRIVRAQGVCWDLQRNVRISLEETRGILTSGGRRYKEDMVNMTMRAAASIALRNAILRVIPRAYVDPIVDEAKKVAIGKGLTMEQRRQRIKEQYAEIGAKESHVLLLAHRKGWDDVTVDDIVHLKGLRTAVLEGHVSLDQALSNAADDNVPVVVTPVSFAAAMLKGAEVKAADDHRVEPKIAVDPVVEAFVAATAPAFPKTSRPAMSAEDRAAAALFGGQPEIAGE